MHKSLAGFLIGGLTAATIALLYAPQSGEELRQEIKSNVLDAKETASMAVEDAKRRLITTVEETRGRAQQMLESVSQEARHKTGKLKEIGSTMVDEQKESLERGVGKAAEVLDS